MKTEYLADHPEFIPILSKWFVNEWSEYYVGKPWQEIAKTFSYRLNKDSLPLSLIALDNKTPVGTISILTESITTHNHLTPWLGGLFVPEESRKNGIGRSLIDSAVEKAVGLEIKQLFIGIRTAEEYYRGLGWELVERISFHGEDISIMRYETIRP